MVDDKLETELQKYDKVYKTFQQFFDADELGALIDRKADNELIYRLQDEKADKTEHNEL